MAKVIDDILKSNIFRKLMMFNFIYFDISSLFFDNFLKVLVCAF